MVKKLITVRLQKRIVDNLKAEQEKTGLTLTEIIESKLDPYAEFKENANKT